MKRLLKTLLLSAKIFLYLFVVKIRNIFGPRSKKLGVSRILDIISSHFANELGSFRGPLMKAGQFMSMIDNSNSQMQPHLEKLLTVQAQRNIKILLLLSKMSSADHAQNYFRLGIPKFMPRAV